jgi:glyoxylase-like metal-dependent hydrolase (beta-lactamase superfamily II)
VRIETYPLGAFQVNSYLLFCEESGECVVVDPGDEPGVLLDRLDELGVAPVAVVNTHGHLDHVAGNAAMKERFGIPVHLHPDDRFLIDTFPEQAARFGLDLAPPPPPDFDLLPGRPFEFGRCRLEVRHAPGHSPGHVVLFHEREAISGDVLFAGSIGRTDLPGGDLGTLLRSIDEVLVPRGDDLVIRPGHGPATTVGRERGSNPFLDPAFRRQMLGG